MKSRSVHELKYILKTLLLLSAILGTNLQANDRCEQSYKVQAFVERFYLKVLDRQAENAGLNDWTNKLIQQERTGSDVAYGFVFSGEFLNKNKNNTDFLHILYQAFFNREADADGIAYWEALLLEGKTREAILEGFLHSPEFINLSEAYGIRAFADSSIVSSTLTAFVQRFYTQILGREADPVGLKDWTQTLASQENTAAGLARGFVFSSEFTQRQTNNTDFLHILYQAFFNREADTAGLNGWLEALQNGNTREEVLNSFLHSQEFINLTNTYGILAYEGATPPQNITNTNTAPTANAGTNQEVKETQTLRLSAAQSTDSDGQIVCYRWKESSNILGNSQDFATNSFSVGLHSIDLTVVDDKGATSKTTVSVKVVENDVPLNWTIYNPHFIPAYDYSKQMDYYDIYAFGPWELSEKNNPFDLNLSETEIDGKRVCVIKTVNDNTKGISLYGKGFTTKVNSKYFYLDPTKRYQAVIRMKAKNYPLGQNILLTLQTPRGDNNEFNKGYKIEVSWNVSSSDWEEINLVIDPTVIENARGSQWYFQFMASTYYRAYAPEEDLRDVYIDEDIDIFEIPKGRMMVNTQDINLSKDKKIFESSYRKIDELGNFYIKDDNAEWKHIFPKLIYRNTNLNDGDSEKQQIFKRYKDYGFDGVLDFSTLRGLNGAIKAGLTNNTINGGLIRNINQVNYEAKHNILKDMHDGIKEMKQEKNIIWINVDNEKTNIPENAYQKWLAKYADENMSDPGTGKRAYPIYYLNGHYGLTRTYSNENLERAYCDVTGSYLGKDVNGKNKHGKVDVMYRLISQFNTQNQRIPASVIQLQKHYTDKFIPSLFFGIIQGGRALNVWRDGSSSLGQEQNEGVPSDFRDNVWASTFRDEVSGRLDEMLPIIKTPQYTPWTATTDSYPSVRLGTRQTADKGYIILANFSDEDKQVTIKLHDVSIVEAKDFFTHENIPLDNNILIFDMGHDNAGYRVIELTPKVP